MIRRDSEAQRTDRALAENKRDFRSSVAALVLAPSPRALRFFVVGLLNTAFGYAIFYFVWRATLDSTVAAGVSTAIGALFNFLSIGRLVFGSADPRFLGRFIAVYAALFIVDAVALRALEHLGAEAALAQAALTPVLATLSYLLNRDFVFRTGAGDA